MKLIQAMILWPTYSQLLRLLLSGREETYASLFSAEPVEKTDASHSFFSVLNQQKTQMPLFSLLNQTEASQSFFSQLNQHDH